MDERRHKILIALVFTMAIRHVIAELVALQQIALHQHFDMMSMMMVMIETFLHSPPRVRNVWRYERVAGFMERQLLGSFSERMFRQRTRLSYLTFNFLCTIVAPSLQRQVTHLRECIPVETRVAVALARIGSGNTLSMCGEVYGIAESTASIIVREFSAAIRVHLKAIVIEKPTARRIQEMAREFEDLHGLPYIIGAIDGSHIPIIAPTLDPTSYYCRKGFYSTLLQGVVDAKCKFWDYDYGWAGRCHDWALFQRTDIGKRVMRGAFLPYRLIGDAAYPMRPWFYSPFKGEKEGLSREKAHWNFIQSSTRMAVERAFGMLKGRWRILLKRADVPLRHMPDLVTACICLHNLCIIHSDGFDMEWAREAQSEMQEEANSTLGRVHGDMFYVAEEAIKQMRRLQISTVEDCTIDEWELDGSEEDEEGGRTAIRGRGPTKKADDDKMKQMLSEATMTHELLAKTFYETKLKNEATLVFPDTSDSDSEMVE